MQHRGSQFIADWKDSLGRRHRKAFAREIDARRHEHSMIAEKKIAVELGRRIGLSTFHARNRPKLVTQLVSTCSKIAQMTALSLHSRKLRSKKPARAKARKPVALRRKAAA